MTDQHRATLEQWAKCEQDARLWSGAFNCILELRARIEALEAAQQPRPKPPSLKEQALEAAIRLGKKYPSYEGADIETIRRALEGDPDRLAAALRAVADQARRGPEHWEGSHPDDFDKGWDEAMDWVYAMIAAELEALPND
jgi:hypothetical protein